MFVILFDIDGTLIHSGGAGQGALEQALTEEFGIVQPQRVSISGRTDRGIVRDLFRLHQIPETPENWTRYHAAYLRHLPQHLAARPGCVLPGVVDLLARLREYTHVALGLLTGNVREGARIKLEHFRLADHFCFGGYGDDHFDRNEVATLAWTAACAHVQWPLSPERTWVIGDTPLDIRCARWIGARAVAVATGLHPRTELAQANPDLLVDDLTQTDWLEDELRGGATCV